MIGITVKADVEQVKQWLGILQREKVNRAASRAINKTLINVRTEASKRIKEERDLSSSSIKASMKIIKANKNKLYGELIATGRPIPIRDYHAVQTKAGVTVSVTPGRRKLVTKYGNNSFIVNRLGGHVFVRLTHKRLKIIKLYGPSIPSTFLKRKIVDAMMAKANDAWSKRFAEEIRYELSK